VSSFLAASSTVPPDTQVTTLGCNRCGVRVGIVLPADISSLVAITKGFEELHAKCEHPEEEPDET